MVRTLLLLGLLNVSLAAWSLCAGSHSMISPENGTLAPTLEFVPSSLLQVTGAPVNVPAPFSATVRNLSNAAIKITNVTTSCGCTDFEIASRRIPRNGTTVLSGTVRGKPRPETASARITLDFESTGSEQMKGQSELLLSVEFVSAIAIAPETLTLKPDNYSDTRGAGEFHVSSHSDPELEYDILAPQYLNVSPSVLHLSPGQTQTVGVWVTSDTSRGRGVIRLRNKANGELRTVNVAITPGKSVYPEARLLALGVIRQVGRQTVSTRPATIVLRGEGLLGADVNIRNVPSPLCNGIVEHTDGRCVIRFSLKRPATIVSGRINGILQLDVKLENGQIQVIRIPVVGVISDMEQQKV